MFKFIPAIVFLIVIYLNYRYVKRWICLSNFILFLYFLSSVSYIFLTLFSPGIYYTIQGLAAIAIPTVFLVIPLSVFEKNNSNKDFNKIPTRKVQITTWVLIVLGFYSIFFFIQGLRNFFSVDIVELRSGHGAMYEGGTIFSKVACMGAYLYPVSLYMFYYNLLKRQVQPKINKLLFVSSFSFIIYTLNVAGRDGIVLWALTFVGFFCFYKNYLSHADNQKLMKVMRVGGLLFMPLFIYITLSRFDQSSIGGLGSVFSYMGQQLNVMSEDIDVAQSTGQVIGNTRSSLEFFHRIIDLFSGEISSRVNRFDFGKEAQYLGYRANAFGTYVHSFYPINMNLWQFSIFVLVVFFVYKSCLKTNECFISAKHLLTACSWYTILISGIFYFYYGTYIGNVFLLLSLLFILIL